MNEPNDREGLAEAELAGLRAEARRLGFAEVLDPGAHDVELESADDLLRRLRDAAAEAEPDGTGE